MKKPEVGSLCKLIVRRNPLKSGNPRVSPLPKDLGYGGRREKVELTLKVDDPNPGIFELPGSGLDRQKAFEGTRPQTLKGYLSQRPEGYSRL